MGTKELAIKIKKLLDDKKGEDIETRRSEERRVEKNLLLQII